MNGLLIGRKQRIGDFTSLVPSSFVCVYFIICILIGCSCYAIYGNWLLASFYHYNSCVCIEDCVIPPRYSVCSLSTKVCTQKTCNLNKFTSVFCHFSDIDNV